MFSTSVLLCIYMHRLQWSLIAKQSVCLVDPISMLLSRLRSQILSQLLSQLRSQVAMVPQDPFLFGEPLKENLTYDDPNRALDEIWAAANSADLKQTIENFPEKLETLVGERGVTLSGGQKQRATLARGCLLYTSPSPRDKRQSRMPSSA